ncbi:hypothetical protein E2C01_096483 [Portunus trituberculatus]|uniref:Uncharacterized protein n=1 Tax=Portunus trituberculatus TaxID=210409 RepID=A0A5B7K8C6_PORTR|nr:hypothetical protein [Portunus trituberculatus]
MLEMILSGRRNREHKKRSSVPWSLSCQSFQKTFLYVPAAALLVVTRGGLFTTGIRLPPVALV